MKRSIKDTVPLEKELRSLIPEGSVFTTGKFDELECISRVFENSYFSHSSALLINDMHERIPKAIYLSCENSRKKDPVQRPPLTQKTIDRAFSTPFPSCKRYFFNDRIIILNEQDYSRTGVVCSKSGNYFYTDPERTIIDCLVRPDLAGGIETLIKVLVHFRGKYSVDKIRDYLIELNLEFPYHQSMGYILEVARFSSQDLRKFQEMGTDLRFYLDRQILHPYHDIRWNLVHPEEIY